MMLFYRLLTTQLSAEILRDWDWFLIPPAVLPTQFGTRAGKNTTNNVREVSNEDFQQRMKNEIVVHPVAQSIPLYTELN